MNKQDYRQSVLKLRDNFIRQNRLKDDLTIATNLDHMIERLSNRKQELVKLAGYFSMKGEPNLKNLFVSLDRANGDRFRLLMPHLEQGSMSFVTLTDKNLQYNYGEKDAFLAKNDIMEPEIILIPAIACGYNGYRIGFGKGYYDRYLANKKNIIKIGVVYHDFLFESVPAQSHDVKMDYIVTEQTIIAL